MIFVALHSECVVSPHFDHHVVFSTRNGEGSVYFNFLHHWLRRRRSTKRSCSSIKSMNQSLRSFWWLIISLVLIDCSFDFLAWLRSFFLWELLEKLNWHFLIVLHVCKVHFVLPIIKIEKLIVHHKSILINVNFNIKRLQRRIHATVIRLWLHLFNFTFDWLSWLLILWLLWLLCFWRLSSVYWLRLRLRLDWHWLLHMVDWLYRLFSWFNSK